MERSDAPALRRGKSMTMLHAVRMAISLRQSCVVMTPDRTATRVILNRHFRDLDITDIEGGLEVKSHG